jgi:Homeodomain-like domain-containing protein
MTALRFRPGSDWAKLRFRGSPPREARNRDIVAKLDRGMTLQAVGDQYGISRQRVHQIRQRLEREGVQ